MDINWKEISIEDLAGLVSSHLNKYDISVTLVGGACVSIYSKYAYISGDLDLIVYHEKKKIRAILQEIGFEMNKHGYYAHSDCPYFLEFVNPPIAVGNEPVVEFYNKKTPFGDVKLLTPTDCVKDRLAAYYHWSDEQSLEQALLVANELPVNHDAIEKWSIREKMYEKFVNFKTRLNRKSF